MNQTTATPDALHLDDPATCPQSTPPVIESTLTQGEVTSTQPPPEPDIEDMPTVPLTALKREFHFNSWFLLALALLVILVGEHAQGIVTYMQTMYFNNHAQVTLFTSQKTEQHPYTLLVVTGTPDATQKQIPSRFIQYVSPVQTITVSATGYAQTQPTPAYGSITFYNDAPYVQTIDAGTVIQGDDGVETVTDQTVTIAAGTGIANGSVTTTAHTLQTGSNANIPAYDVNRLCCLSGIRAINTESFRGGEDPQTYSVVSQNDMTTAQSKAAVLLDPLAKEAVTRQVNATEQSLTPLQCSFTTHATPAVGEKAARTTVTIQESCTMQVYDYAGLQQFVQAQFFHDVTTHLGVGYTPKHDITVSLAKPTLVDRSHHTYALPVVVQATLIYHPTATQLHSLTSLIAGKSLREARSILLANAGIEGVYIQPANAPDTSLPSDPAQIQIHLV